MPPTRLPYWLSAADRAALAVAIADLCASTAVVPALRRMLDAVSLELGVAEARDQVWPHATEIRRQATGTAPDRLPVRMSEDELAAVLTIPALQDGIRSRLTQAAGRGSLA